MVTSLLWFVGAFWNLPQFFRSYLFAFLFWTGIGLGCLALAMLHQLTSGAWGIAIRRPLEAGFRTLPWMALAFLPLIVGLRFLYGWIDGAGYSREQLQYFYPPLFVLRGALYFTVWLWLARLLGRYSDEQDRSGSSEPAQRMRLLSGPGLILYGLTASFASIDWIMSLAPGWYSSIFGLLFISGHLLSAIAFAICILILLSQEAPLAGFLQARHVHDLGKLLLTFVMLWAYLAFSQLLIIWSGNLSREIPWYLHRWDGGWQWVGLALILFHFLVPFFLLLSRELKRSGPALARVALLVLFMRAVDLFWLIAPEFSPRQISLHWMDVAGLFAMGGFWIALFASQLQRRPLLPVADPHFSEALEPQFEERL